MSTIEAFIELKREWQKQRAELEERGQEIVLSVLQELFDKNENLKEIKWRQYTPYFNDGDECVFSTGAFSPTVNGWEENRYWDYCNDSEEEDNESTKVSEELYKEIVEVLSILDTDDYKEIFGNHITVTFTKEGYEVDGYDHD